MIITYWGELETPETYNLEALTNLLGYSLTRFTTHHQKVDFGKISPFELTPEKPYTARTAVPVLFDKVSMGGMTVILFKPKDGTGNFETYPREIVYPQTIRSSIVLSPDYNFENTPHPERTIPREKTGDSEIAIPLFSVGRDYSLPFASSLAVLEFRQRSGDRPSRLTRTNQIGVSPEAYASLRRAQYPYSFFGPHWQFTYDRKEDHQDGVIRLEHALFYEGKLRPNKLQAIGFLEVKHQATDSSEEENPKDSMFYSWLRSQASKQ